MPGPQVFIAAELDACNQVFEVGKILALGIVVATRYPEEVGRVLVPFTQKNAVLPHFQVVVVRAQDFIRPTLGRVVPVAEVTG